MTSASPASGRPGRLVRSADFERLLQTRSRMRSAHFALHHLPGRPGTRDERADGQESHKLSTGDAPKRVIPVDDFAPSVSGELWLGTVVPKRHARRSVTRSLLKRQIRAAVGARMPLLAGGLWVVRLCAPFDRSRFTSAASTALQRAARVELDGLLARVASGANA